jgi:DNA repair protein RadA/Sms
VAGETNLDSIIGHIRKLSPTLVVIDSIQTIYRSDLAGAPGSIGQVRECAVALLRLAKETNIVVVLVGHVTKAGYLAGPRVLEHVVDCVLYFEGERYHSFRILRAIKNRFGSTNEIGVFQMQEIGLQEVANPSEVFLAERPLNTTGSVVVASLEGTRPVLLEIQALVSGSAFGNPRRLTTGIDLNRALLMVAVLDKRIGMVLANQDIYLNVAGGLKVEEPAVDLGVCLAIASSLRNCPVDPFAVLSGEVGLTGEVRGVSQVEQRITEATKMGFRNFILPGNNLKNIKSQEKITLTGVTTVEEALEVVLGG